MYLYNDLLEFVNEWLKIIICKLHCMSIGGIIHKHVLNIICVLYSYALKFMEIINQLNISKLLYMKTIFLCLTNFEVSNLNVSEINYPI